MAEEEHAEAEAPMTAQEIRAVLAQVEPYLPKHVRILGHLSEDHVIGQWVLWAQVGVRKVPMVWPLAWDVQKWEAWLRAELEHAARAEVPA